MLVDGSGREISSFRVALARPLGTKRATGRGSFIDSVIGAVNEFYEAVAQNVTAWRAAPSQIRPQPELEKPNSLDSTALSSQDGPSVASEYAASVDLAAQAAHGDGASDSPADAASLAD